MKLIIGLGNPGKEYEATRHNIGFIIVDELLKAQGINKYESKFKGYYAKFKLSGEDVIVLKPQTFMNLSGESVREVMQFFKIELDDILVVYDDLDLELGKLRFKQKSSSGGHNGIKSIEQCLGSNEFKRLKFGIDRNSNIPTAKYVLGKFSSEDIGFLKPRIEIAVEACMDFIKLDFINLMNKYN